MEKTILVVDDSPDTLEALRFLLDTSGYNVITDSGDDIKGKIEKNIPDLVLLDIFLPGQDGRRISKKLKAQDSTKNLPIIFISAHKSEERSIKAYGANDFLAKPFEIDDLLAKIEKYTYSKN